MHQAEQHELAMSAAYPGVWQRVADFRYRFKDRYPAPIALADRILGPMQAPHVKRGDAPYLLAALAAWRQGGRRVIEVDPELERQLLDGLPVDIHQPLPKDLVVSALRRGGLYISFPRAEHGSDIVGMYAHLDIDPDGEELRLLMTLYGAMIPFPLPLHQEMTLYGAMKRLRQGLSSPADAAASLEGPIRMLLEALSRPGNLIEVPQPAHHALPSRAQVHRLPAIPERLACGGPLGSAVWDAPGSPPTLLPEGYRLRAITLELLQQDAFDAEDPDDTIEAIARYDRRLPDWVAGQAAVLRTWIDTGSQVHLFEGDQLSRLGAVAWAHLGRMPTLSDCRWLRPDAGSQCLHVAIKRPMDVYPDGPVLRGAWIVFEDGVLAILADIAQKSVGHTPVGPFLWTRSDDGFQAVHNQDEEMIREIGVLDEPILLLWAAGAEVLQIRPPSRREQRKSHRKHRATGKGAGPKTMRYVLAPRSAKLADGLVRIQRLSPRGIPQGGSRTASEGYGVAAHYTTKWVLPGNVQEEDIVVDADPIKSRAGNVLVAVRRLRSAYVVGSPSTQPSIKRADLYGAIDPEESP